MVSGAAARLGLAAFVIGAAVAVALLIDTEHADGAEATSADPVGALTEGATNLLSDVDRTLEGAPETLDEKVERTERRLTETLESIPPPAPAVPGLPSLPEPVDVTTARPDAAAAPSQWQQSAAPAPSGSAASNRTRATSSTITDPAPASETPDMTDPNNPRSDPDPAPSPDAEGPSLPFQLAILLATALVAPEGPRRRLRLVMPTWTTWHVAPVSRPG